MVDDAGAAKAQGDEWTPAQSLNRLLRSPLPAPRIRTRPWWFPVQELRDPLVFYLEAWLADSIFGEPPPWCWWYDPSSPRGEGPRRATLSSLCRIGRAARTPRCPPSSCSLLWPTFKFSSYSPWTRRPFRVSLFLCRPRSSRNSRNGVDEPSPADGGHS